VEPDIDYAQFWALTCWRLFPAPSPTVDRSQKVYVLRWIAGKHAGVPEFTPPYTIDG
jgi:hypothetical protein